jgi:uncharacterized membrane protein
MKLRLPDIVALGTLALLVLGTLAVYGALPDSIPIHLDLSGNVDGYAPRAIGALVLPLSAIAVFAVIRLRSADAAATWTGAITIVFLTALQALLLRMALTRDDHAGAALGVILGIFSVAIGLLFPRLRRNRFIGIRVPWTLASDENWARTHLFAGRLFAIGGLVTLFACIVDGTVGTVVAVLSLIATSIVTTIHSFRLTRTT